MKGLSFPVALLSFFGLALPGCSDESSTPVAPVHQTVQALVTLEKCNRTDFTFSHNPIPPYIIDPGDVKLVRGKWIMKNVGVVEQVVASDPLVSGTMVHYLSGTLDAVTGEGPVHGTFTLTPNVDVGGGVWKGSYEGWRSKSDGIYFKLPLKVVGHGRGGTLDRMQIFEESMITAWGTPPEGWWGGGKGFYKSH